MFIDIAQLIGGFGNIGFCPIILCLVGWIVLTQWHKCIGDNKAVFRIHEIHIARIACRDHGFAKIHRFRNGQPIALRAMQRNINIAMTEESIGLVTVKIGIE